MKLLKTYALLSALFAGSFMIMAAQDEDTDTDATEATDQSDQVIEYKNSLQQEYKNLRKLIIKAAPKDVIQLNNAFRAIQTIEKDPKYGITELQRKSAELRVEACKKQLADKEIKALNDASIEKVQEIDQLTKPEQQKSNELTQQMQKLMETKKSTDDPEVKKIENDLKEINKQMREKTKEQVKLVQENNAKVYEKMPDFIDKGKDLGKKIKKAYTEAKTEIDKYDKTVANKTEAINKALKKHEAQLKKIRTSIKDLRTKIYEIEPCFSAQESLDDMDKAEYNWEQLFIS